MAIKELIEKLEEIREKILASEKKFSKELSVNENFMESAKNLVHYLTLRTFDLRKIQGDLVNNGLSSIGSAEGYTLNCINHVLDWLYLKEGIPKSNHIPEGISFRASTRLLRYHTDGLFGKLPQANAAHIMVTLPTEAGEDFRFVENLMFKGMDIARINMSHDNPEVWRSMVKNIRKAEKKNKLACKIYMDLAGPKIRTTTLIHRKKKKKPVRNKLRLFKGDLVYLFDGLKPEKIEKDLPDKMIGISIPSILEDIIPGQNIFFDDGRIGGEVLKRLHNGFIVEIVRCNFDGNNLRSCKGVNLPSTNIHLPSLMPEDIFNLNYCSKWADIVGYSFVRTAEDVNELVNKIHEVAHKDMGIVIKIETNQAYEELPSILLKAMKVPYCGVMIARGDLAVEVGFERISGIQDKIMRVCEAAHVPVIWATQVLETLAKKGLATRAEISDVVLAAQAECIMLNKGPYILNTLDSLNSITQRMSKYQLKKKSKMKPLTLATRFCERTKTKARMKSDLYTV